MFNAGPCQYLYDQYQSVPSGLSASIFSHSAGAFSWGPCESKKYINRQSFGHMIEYIRSINQLFRYLIYRYRMLETITANRICFAKQFCSLTRFTLICKIYINAGTAGGLAGFARPASLLPKTHLYTYCLLSIT